MIRRAALTLLALATSSTLSAQTMRSFSTSRPVAGERMLRATIDFGAGRVTVQPGSAGELYRMQLRYDADRNAPVQAYEHRTGILRLGLESIGKGMVRVTNRQQLEQSARFEFSPEVPLALSANVGASEATLDLGGLTLVEFALRGGASRAVVDFSRPTRGECRSATFNIGAAELEARRLAAAGCAELRVEGGVGRAVLSFDGAWRRDARLVAGLAMGTLTLRIPKGVGVRVTAQRFLSSWSAEGFVRQGDAMVTEGFDRATRKLTVELKTSVTGVNVEWID